MIINPVDQLERSLACDARGWQFESARDASKGSAFRIVEDRTMDQPTTTEI
jgi:hypothetical protein